MKEIVNKPAFLIIHLAMIILVVVLLYMNDMPKDYKWAIFSHAWTPFVMMAAIASCRGRMRKAVVCAVIPFVCSALYCFYSVFAYAEFPFGLAITCKTNLYLAIAISTLAIDVYYNDGFYSDKEIEDETK